MAQLGHMSTTPRQQMRNCKLQIADCKLQIAATPVPAQATCRAKANRFAGLVHFQSAICNLQSAIVLLLLCAASGVTDAAEPTDPPWAFQTPRRATIPAVKNKTWVRNPIDAFVLARLEAEHVAPAPEADRATIVRRLYFDLIGLPPGPEELESALSDKSQDWYERLVDRLLGSSQYGERWATFWLDLVRFAETDGFKADGARPEAWRYRDYVIRSLNNDKPYDRFIREQLAGDELYPDDTDALIATGFLRHYPDEFNAVNL